MFMKKLLVISLLLISPSLAFAHAAHFNLDASSYMLGDTITYSDSDAGCHGIGCSSQTNAWWFYLDTAPSSIYAYCGNRTSGTYAANCTKVMDSGQSYPRAGAFTVIVNGDTSCVSKTYAECAAAGGQQDLITFSVTDPYISLANVNSAISAAKTDISSVAGTTLTVILALVGLFIAGGVAWRMLKRHIGQPIGGPVNGPYSNDLKAAMRIRANKKFMDATDE